MSLNGRTLDLAAGRYRATVAAAGATLVSLTHDGRDLVVPFDPVVTIGVGWQGRTLAPWPNRISDSRYTFDGVTYGVPCNEGTTGAALHGMASWTPWDVQAEASDSVAFTLDLPATEYYPFDIRLVTRYLVDEEAGLFVVISATNEGGGDAPVGLSTHPYLTCGAPADECVFGLEAGQVLMADERMRPAGLVPVDGTPFDVRTPVSLDGRHIDNAYTGVSAEGWTAVLAHPDGYGVALSSDQPWVQVFTGDAPGLDRGGVAVEPMTCAPDAFNSDPDGVRLAPGDSLLLRFAIRAV